MPDFRDGNKSNGPEIFKRNREKIFPAEEGKPKERKIVPANQESLQEMIKAARKREQESQEDTVENLERPSSTREIILEAELQQAEKDLTDLKQKTDYLHKHYIASVLGEDVLKMETGLPTKDVFLIIVNSTCI